MKQFLIPLALTALLGLGQCKKSEPDPAPVVNPIDLLPPATQTGQRTFGCLLNGQAWIPVGNPLNGPIFTAEYFTLQSYKNHLSLKASGACFRNNYSDGGVIGIGIDNITAPGRYILNQKDTSSVGYTRISPSCYYTSDAAHPAIVTITKLDFTNRIVSGTFSFTLETASCGKVVVTDGRFDSPF